MAARRKCSMWSRALRPELSMMAGGCPSVGTNMRSWPSIVSPFPVQGSDAAANKSSSAGPIRLFMHDVPADHCHLCGNISDGDLLHTQRIGTQDRKIGQLAGYRASLFRSSSKVR